MEPINDTEGTKRTPSAKKKPARKSASRKRLTPTDKVRKSRAKVLGDMPKIVTKICEEAKNGNCGAAKFVFDFAGITELKTPLEEPQSSDSLAGLLLEKLDGSGPPDPGPGTIE